MIVQLEMGGAVAAAATDARPAACADANPATLLLLEADPDVAAGAMEGLASPSHHITIWSGLDTAARPDVSRFDLVIVGQPAGNGGGLIDALRPLSRGPIIPLYRPLLAPLKRSSDFRAATRLACALEDCRARIRQHLDHPRIPSGMAVDWGGFNVMLKARSFAFDGKPLDLTEVQSAILSNLMQSAGEIVTKSHLQHHILGHKPATVANVIEVHISRLRDKLAAVGAPVFLENVRNAGYVLFWHPAGSEAAIPMPDPYILIEGRPVRLSDLTAPTSDATPVIVEDVPSECDHAARPRATAGDPLVWETQP